MTGASLCDRLLEACAKLGEAELAALVVQSMHALGVPVGYVAHGCLLRALCVAGYHEVCSTPHFPQGLLAQLARQPSLQHLHACWPWIPGCSGVCR